MQFSLREIRAVLREVLAKWAELLTDGELGEDLFEMHRGDLAKEIAPWAGHGDKFLKALRLAYVLGIEHALAIAVKTAMGDDEDPGEWESIEYLVPKLLVQNSVAEEKKKSAGNKGKPAHTQKVNTAEKAVNTYSKIVPAVDKAVNTDSKTVPAQTDSKIVPAQTADKAVNTDSKIVPAQTDSKIVPVHVQTVTVDKTVNTDSKTVPAQTSTPLLESNPEIPEMFQKTTMADSASLKQTEIENSFAEMKAILEALRKEVRQINAGTSDPSLTNCDTSSQQRTRNASSQTVFSPEWSQGIQELQKRSVKLRRDRYRFGRNKIIRERERNLSYCWNAFHSKTSKWTSLFFSDHDKFADPRSSS